MKKDPFLVNRAEIESWLLSEKAQLENENIYMGYWFHSGKPNGFGLSMVGVNSGEFHLNDKGKVSMYIEKGLGNLLYESESTATTKKTLLQLYENFKNRIQNKHT